MCPDFHLLEQLALGLLSGEEAAPLEEHLADCASCLQTLIERDPADTLVEALREAPRTAERRAAFEDDIRRLEAAFAARPWGDLPRSSVENSGDGGLRTQEHEARDDLGRSPHEFDTSPSASGSSVDTPPTEAESADDREVYDFLAPPQSPDELGRLGTYRVLRVLGTGGMGVVFEAEDPQLKRHVALKAMKPGGAVSASARKRFLREAQTAAAVEHDHIVPVYQVGEDRGVPFIAMPLLRGETLAERLEKAEGKRQKAEGQGAEELNPKSKIENPKSRDGLGRPSSGKALPVDEVIRIGREIALGLSAAHRRGLIHRDIKPSNIWLEEETGRAKILDFGLARASDGGEQLTQAGAMLGTPAYMSPEQASGDDADARSDLFSLGCVLYHAATGRRPFIGRDALSTMVAVTTVTPPAPRELNPALPHELSNLIVALLSKDPAGRPQTAREVADRLASIVLPLPPGESRGEGGLQEASASTIELAPADELVGNAHPTKPPRRRGLVLIASAAAAAALAGIVFFVQTNNGTIRVEINDPQIEVAIKGTNITLKQADNGADVKVWPGEKTLVIERGDFQFETDKLVLKRGDTITVAVTLSAGGVEVKQSGEVIGQAKLPERSVATDSGIATAEPREKAVVRNPPSVATDHGPRTTDNGPNPKSKIQNPKLPPPLPALSQMSLVTEPAPLPGLTSWTLETLDHRGEIHKMEFNPDGTLLATYGEDGAVRLWHSETGELARIFVGADSPSGGIAWSPDGASIAVAAGSKINAWQAATGKSVCNISLIDGEAASLAWSPDGKTFAVGQRPVDQPQTDLLRWLTRAPAEQLCLYDVATGVRTAVRRRDDWNVEQIAWSPDSKRLIESGEKSPSFLVTAAELVVHAIRAPESWEAALAWTAEGKPLFARPWEVEKKLVMQLWQADPPKLLRTFATQHEGERIGWLALSGDARLVVLGCRDTYQGYASERAAYVYDAETGDAVAHFAHSPGHPGEWKNEDAPPLSSWEYEPRYALSRDGKRFARCGQQLGGPAVFDIRSGETLRDRRRMTTFWLGYPHFLAAWSPDGESLAVRGEDGAAQYIDIPSAWPRAAGPAGVYGYPGFNPYTFEGLRWSADSSHLTMAHALGGRIEIQSAKTGQAESNCEVRPEAGADPFVYCTALSADAKFFVGIHGGRLRVFESAGSRLLKTLDAMIDKPETWSPDAKRLAVRHGEATEIWDIEANECVRRFDGGSASLVWSPDGSRFVLSGGGEATIHDAASGNVLHDLDEPPLGSAKDWPRLAWSPDSRRIAGRGRVWNAETGEVIARLPGAALAGETGAPAWSPDGATLAYLGPGRAVVVADLAPKVRHSTAQGETLGNVKAQNIVALKGRDSDGSQRLVGADGAIDAGESRPVGAENSNAKSTQGSAALHPGLSNSAPSGSPQVTAMLLTFNRGQVVSISPSGHYRASPRADELLVYVVETADGQETLSREQFAERFGWKNDPAWAARNVAPTLRGGVAVAEGDRLALPSRSAGSTLGSLALVQRPAALPGVESWTIAQRSPQHVPNQWQPISLSPDAKWLAHAGQDGAVRLIDANSGKAERVLAGHDGPLAAVAFSPDGKLVASFDCIARNVRIWDAATGAQRRSVQTGLGRFYSALHWSPDGALLAVCTQYAPLRLLDVASGEFLPQPIGHSGLLEPDYFAWSPDGRRFVSCADGNREIRIWDVATLEPAFKLESKFDTAPYVTFGWSPDGKTLAAHVGRGEIRVWDAVSGKLLRTLADKHPVWDVRLAWLPDGETIAINGGNGALGWRLWDVIAAKPVMDVVPYGYIWGFSLSADGQTLAMGDARIGLFDVRSRTLRREIEASLWAQSAAWSPDGRELAVTGDDMAVWSNARARGLTMLPTENWFGAQWLQRGDAILNTVGGGAMLFSRRAQHWEKRHLPIGVGSYGGHDVASLSPNGNLLACSNNDIKAEDLGKRRVEIWDLATAKRLVQMEPLGQYIHALAWSPDGELLAAGTDDGKSAIYDSASGKRLAELPATKGPIRPLAFSPDGKTLAAGYGAHDNGFVRLYNVGELKASGRPEGTRRQASGEEDGEPLNPSPLPEGEGVRADASLDPKPQIENPKSATPPEPKADGTRSVPATLPPLRELPCDQTIYDPEIVALRWSADGRTLQVLDRAAVYVFDATTGERLAEAPRLDRTPHGHRPANFSPDGRYLAVATTCTRVWDLAELNEAAERKASGVRRQASEVDGEPEGNAASPHPSPSPRTDGTAKTQDPSPKTSPSNPKSKIENPKLHLVASVVPLGHGQAVVVSGDGHWLGTRGAEKEIVYVIRTTAGQETLTPREFYKRFGWKNDPNKVVLP